MKSLKIYTIGMIMLLLLTGVVIVSCTKSFDEKTVQQKDFNNSTLAQVFVATVNASRNYVYVDGNPVTGAVLASGSVFPTTAYSFNVPGGLRAFTIRDTLRTSTQLPLVFAENMEVGKNYTIFAYDTITSPKQITVPTSIEVPSDNSCRLRFANFIYAPFALPSVDVFSFNKNANLFTDIPVTGVTDFVSYPSGLSSDTLYIRETGTMNLVYKLGIIGGLTSKRSYTFVYRGSHRGVRTSSLFANY